MYDMESAIIHPDLYFQLVTSRYLICSSRRNRVRIILRYNYCIIINWFSESEDGSAVICTPKQRHRREIGSNAKNELDKERFFNQGCSYTISHSIPFHNLGSETNASFGMNRNNKRREKAERIRWSIIHLSIHK
jgi:hypothetical protein